MNTAPDNNPFAAPTAHVADIPQAGAQPLGGRGARLGSVIIDGIIQGAAYYAIAFTMFSALLPNNTSSDSSVSGLAGVFALQIVISVVLFIVLHGYLLATQGQTIGKRLLGLRILRSNGERASLGRLLGLRYFLGWVLLVIPFVGAIYGLADCLMIFRDSRKCLHDNIADTIVVKA
jgi:uncharacterized RDD family membrane protein YckC